MELNSNTVPAWILGLVIVYTGLSWLFPRKELCIHCRKIFASGFLIWGTAFFILFTFFPLDLETRGFISRTMILMICLSQSIPLTLLHIRRVIYDRKQDRLQ